MLVSQPFAKSPSQSPQPDSHCPMTQAPSGPGEAAAQCSHVHCGQSESLVSTNPSQSLSCPSAQDTSVGSGGFCVGELLQPAMGSHESSVQTFESSQLTGVVAHAPPCAGSQKAARHLFSLVQLFGGLKQMFPVHASTVQSSLSEQSALVVQHSSTGVPLQVPSAQLSDDVQALPSSHDVA
jgi:hypothetical protein